MQWDIAALGVVEILAETAAIARRRTRWLSQDD
jgi:hypothetical protein